MELTDIAVFAQRKIYCAHIQAWYIISQMITSLTEMTDFVSTDPHGILRLASSLIKYLGEFDNATKMSF